MNLLCQFWTDERGATVIEYGLIAGATCLALGAIMPTLNSRLAETYERIASYFSSFD